MANRVVTSAMLEGEQLEHYGVLGMKWGVRKAKYDTKKLQRRTERNIKWKDSLLGRMGIVRTSRGTKRLARKVRTANRKTQQGIRKAEKLITKIEKANANGVINRYNKDPSRKDTAQSYINTMKDHKIILDELRTQLMDARLK